MCETVFSIINIIIIVIHMQGCIVSVNLHSLHHDPIYWKDPDLFRPERHLVIDDDDDEDKTTNLHRRHEQQQQRLKRSTDHHFLPFSAGMMNYSSI